MEQIAKRLLETITAKGFSYGELSAITKIPKSAIQRYATGQTGKIPIDRLEKIARALGVTAAYLMGWEDSDIPVVSNVFHMPETKKVPLVGEIACGEPILAEENIEDFVDVPDFVKADFALRCKGDSMINARIYDGDIVYIKKQDTVNNGEIAAVLIDNEATLKRVRIYPDHIVLEPENPQYRAKVFWDEEMNEVKIIGKATHFVSTVQ